MFLPPWQEEEKHVYKKKKIKDLYLVNYHSAEKVLEETIQGRSKGDGLYFWAQLDVDGGHTQENHILVHVRHFIWWKLQVYF